MSDTTNALCAADFDAGCGFSLMLGVLPLPVVKSLGRKTVALSGDETVSGDSLPHPTGVTPAIPPVDGMSSHRGKSFDASAPAALTPLHPGRRGRWSSAPITCCVCSWSPPPTELGGVRWKLLAKHYEQHLDELTAPTKV